MKSVVHKTVGNLKCRLKFLKTLVAGCSLLLLLPSARAQFTWPIYEPFGEYTTAIPFKLGAGDSAANWNFGNGTSSSQYLVTNNLTGAAMSFPALLADPNPTPKGVQEVPSGSNASGDRGCIFTAQTGTWYASFLLNYQDNGGMSEDRAAFNVVRNAAAGSFSAVYTAVWLTPDYRLKVTKDFNDGNNLLTSKFSAATPVLTRNVPHLIVMRYVRVAGSNDRVDLWVDPTPFGNDAGIPPATVSTTNGANVASFNGFLFEHRKVNGQSGNTFSVFQLDEVRLGDTWAGVTPLATLPPGPVFTVTGGGIGCPGDTFAVNLDNSVATNDYWLYTNSVFAGVTLTGNGSALNFGSFSAAAAYSVLASNNVNGNLGWMSNSVSVYVRAAVNIATPPSPAITATNSRAQFAVGVTGDELTYQWYKTGNPSPLADDSHLTGSHTNSLVIWPATAADIGSYYCVITNPCTGVSGVTSSSASLTLDAPADLVWYGNHFTVLPLGGVWDISTAFNWNSGGSVFNEGDNATFDDSYSGATFGTILPLVGTLTPTHVTYSTAQDLAWAGSGSLAGSGDLLVSGAGRLTISNTASAGIFLANPFTGGTTISNGTVYVQSANALGTGPITLAGGRLETLGKLAFSNNISVTASSICQLDQSGNQSITLLGRLIGNSGTTLTFTNSNILANSPNAVALNAPFTNNSAIVLSVFRNATNSTQRLILNVDTNGPQVFNGAISDLILIPDGGGTSGGGGVLKQGVGAVYLNAANTYTLGTTNLAGLLAGSGSVASPVYVTNGATLGGGNATTIGTFTINNSLTLNGNVFIRVNKSLAQSNDLISVTGGITNTGTGTVTITNIGVTPLAGGDKFQIFSGAVSNGAALTVTGGGIGWVNNLAVDGSVQAVLGITLLTNSPVITNFSLAGANAVISGTNGQQGGTCYLLMTTNVANPLGQWKTVATNVLGGNAFNFIATNAVTAGSAQQFFMLSSTNYNP